MYGLTTRTTLVRQSYDLTTTALRAVAVDLLKSLYSRSALAVQSQHSGRLAAICCDLLRSVFWCDHKMKMTIERDHAAIISEQTKFKVAEGRSKVAVRCDWGIMYRVL